MRNSALYVLARGGPGLINLLALTLYTRLLTPEQYGQYILILTGLGLVQVVGFQWLGLCLARYLPANNETPERFLSDIKFLFVSLALVFSTVGLVIALLWPDPVWQRLVALAIPLLICSAWFELNLIYAATALKPTLYGQLNLTKAAVSLALGLLLAWVGLGAYSPLWGLLLGATLAAFAFGRTIWRGIKLTRPAPERIKTLFSYGMPLAANFALTWVVTSSDRFLLGWLLDVGSAGQYSVSYDLAQHSIGTLLMIVNLAAYPLVVHALEQSGDKAAREQLKKNGAVIFSLAFTASAGITVLAPLLSGLLLGIEYRDTAVELLPWIALAAMLAGIKAYYFDIAFHLGCGTVKLVWVSVGTASVNIIFNLMWIPHYGILGAAYATVLTYLIGTITSAWLGRHFFTLPDITPLVIPALFIATPSAAAAWLAMQYEGWTGLGLGLLAGMFVAMLSAISINLIGIRHEIRCWLQSR